MLTITNEKMKPGARFEVLIKEVDGDRVIFHRIDFKSFILFAMSGETGELGPVYLCQAGDLPDVFFMACKVNENLDKMFAAGGQAKDWAEIKKMRDDHYGKDTDS